MRPTLVPELSVTDIAVSRRFCCDLLGWQVYAREEQDLLELRLGRAEPMLDALADARHHPHLPPGGKWYRIDGDEGDQRQFIGAGPDGYLLRLAEPLGRRPYRGRHAP